MKPRTARSCGCTRTAAIAGLRFVSTAHALRCSNVSSASNRSMRQPRCTSRSVRAAVEPAPAPIVPAHEPAELPFVGRAAELSELERAYSSRRRARKVGGTPRRRAEPAKRASGRRGLRSSSSMACAGPVQSCSKRDVTRRKTCWRSVLCRAVAIDPARRIGAAPRAALPKRPGLSPSCPTSNRRRPRSTLRRHVAGCSKVSPTCSPLRWQVTPDNRRTAGRRLRRRRPLDRRVVTRRVARTSSEGSADVRCSAAADVAQRRGHARASIAPSTLSRSCATGGNVDHARALDARRRGRARAT